ncbi:MAG: potassium transporter TrkA [Alphaproteobacteria bacterium BRH_c36]|nr:MAG: potassium transporter TrkA [Alphaproteobacteria bacterium BRH_c36]
MAGSINVPAYSDALVILGTAGIVVPLLSRFGLSPVIGYLGAGAVLGPLGLGAFIGEVPFLYWVTVVDANNVAGIAELGVVFLLFIIGLELSFQRLLTMRRLVFGMGSLQIAITTAIVAFVAAGFGLTTSVALIIGASLALSSTAIVLEVLSRQDRLATTTGRLSFSVLLAQDLAVVPLLIYISLIAASNGGTILSGVGGALLQAFVAVVVIIALGRLTLRPLFRLVAATKSDEMFMAAALFVIVATGFLAAISGLSMALGAFVAGLFLSDTEYRRAIQARIEPFKGLLLGIFFFTVGMSIDVREILREPAWILASVIGLVTVKALVVILLARLFRQPLPVAVESGLVLGPGGEFAFVGIGLAASLGLLSSDVSNFTLTVASLSMLLIPAMAMIGQSIAAKITPQPSPEPETLEAPLPREGHAIVIGYGRMGKMVCGLFGVHHIPFVAIDYDPRSVTIDRRNGHEVYYGDATNPSFLKACGIDTAGSVVITIQSPSIIDAIVEQIRLLRADVEIVSRAVDNDHARHLYATGVSDAVPETTEASLQLSEAALLGMNVPAGPVIASIHEERERLRQELQRAAQSTTQGERRRRVQS